MDVFYHNDIVDIDLNSGTVYRSFQNKSIGENDAEANRYGFRCFRNGEPVSLAGATVIGHFVRPDGDTVVIDGGSASGDTAFVTLPQTCYAVEGHFSLAIKLSGGGVTGTIRIVDGTVVNTTSNAIIDPGNLIPDLSEYLAVVDDAVEAAETIRSYSVTARLISGEDYEIIITTGV